MQSIFFITLSHADFSFWGNINIKLLPLKWGRSRSWKKFSNYRSISHSWHRILWVVCMSILSQAMAWKLLQLITQHWKNASVHVWIHLNNMAIVICVGQATSLWCTVTLSIGGSQNGGKELVPFITSLGKWCMFVRQTRIFRLLTRLQELCCLFTTAY